LRLEPGIVLLHGLNGAGKTNLLEALHVGTQGFSPRARRDATMIRFGAEVARVQLDGSHGDNAIETDVVLTRREARRVELNGERLSSGDRMRHELTTLVFTPDRLAVVKGGPATRRAYLDRAAGRLQPSRAAAPSEYASALGQRNAGLRRIRAGFSTQDALAPWTERVAALGAALVHARTEAIELLAGPFTDTAGELGLASATLTYDGEPATADDLVARIDHDLERGITGAGPHLHDVRIAADGRDLRTFGSQGEQRMAVLALVLAEADALRERHDVSPLVLLDDVLSELDGDRRRALAQMVERGTQTVITATAAAALPIEPAQALSVTPGEVR
jgi:DNA replication and repair protein RecF